nr:uncharacterized protein LOC100208687 isoform X2 [Hydra vulgaris]
MQKLRINILCQIFAACLFNCFANDYTLQEIVYPKVLYKKTDRRQRRSLTDGQESELDKSKVNVQFNALGRSFQAHLLLNKRLLAPSFHVEVIGEHNQSNKNYQTENCFYSGRLDKENNSLVSLSTCKGLNGVIQTSTGKYTIEPLSNNENESQNQAHIVKRLSDDLHDDLHRNGNEILKDFFKYSEIGKANKTKIDGFCGLVEKPHVRWVRSVMSEKIGEQTVETMLAVDQKMMQYYGVEAAKQYALTLANIAHGILKDSTIGQNTINLVITKLLILTAPLDDLNINHHAANTLLSFGRWSDKRNVKPDRPEHFDYAVLLTKHDICVDMNQPCETKGLTFVGGMCDHARSAAVVEDNGFASGYTLAHQTGHSLGMDHDGTGNTCDKSLYVMSRDGGKGESAFHWSSCSMDYLQEFLRKPQSQCIENDPHSIKYEDIFSNPGVVYDINAQCQYALGLLSKACTPEQVCQELLCYHPNNMSCLQVNTPVLDGTSCGINQWCKSGRCVKIGVVPTFIVGGNWGQWSEFQECSRSCGGGVAYRERKCLTPISRTNGNYCVGDTRMYAICNKEPCANAINYRKIQCENKGLTFAGDQKYAWTYHSNLPESSCNLKCASLDGLVSQDFGHVLDGTECALSNVLGRCIHGKCNAVGCDMLLGSNSIIDRCGICGGDGNLCEKMLNLSLNPLVVSRNLLNKNIFEKIEEVNEAGNKRHLHSFHNNYLQLRAVMHEIAQKKCGDDVECIKSELVSKRTILPPETKMFIWVSRSLGCSVSCGTGTEVFQPECRRSDDGSAVSMNFCDQLTKPSILSRACGVTPCLPRWSESAWSDCTKSCGGGTKVRTIDCLLQKDNDIYILPATECNTSQRPRHLETCNLIPCPPEWFAEPYGPCSSLCGKGLRTRSVVCRSENKLEKKWVVHPNEDCSNISIPETEMICNANNPCPGDASCGGRWNEKNGTITSPGFPGFYNNNQLCMYEINVSKGKVIALKFLVLDITTPSSVCTSDYLRIFDGRCEDQSKPSVEFCGKQLPSDYISTSENLCLKFVSNFGTTAQGFMINYTEVDSHQHLVSDVCDIKDQVINAPLGIVTSPNYPKEYPTNENCRVSFESPDNSGYFLKMEVFDIGTKRKSDSSCKNDYVELFYDEKSEKLCGKTSHTVHIPTAKFTLSFHSSARKYFSKGFVFVFITEKFRSGLGVKENRFSNFYTGLLETQHKYASKSNASLLKVSSHPMLFPSMKNVNPSHTEDTRAISDPMELTKILHKLVTDDTSKFSRPPDASKLKDWSLVVKKSLIPRPSLSGNAKIINSEAFFKSPHLDSSQKYGLGYLSPATHEDDVANIYKLNHKLPGPINPSSYYFKPYFPNQDSLRKSILPASNKFLSQPNFLQKTTFSDVLPYLNQVNFNTNQPYVYEQFYPKPLFLQNNLENFATSVPYSYAYSYPIYHSVITPQINKGISQHIDSSSGPNVVSNLQHVNSRSAPNLLPNFHSVLVQNNEYNGYTTPLNLDKLKKTTFSYLPNLERSTIIKPDNLRRPKFSYTIDSHMYSDDLSMFGDRDSASVETLNFPSYNDELVKRTLHSSTDTVKRIISKPLASEHFTHNKLVSGGNTPLLKFTLDVSNNYNKVSSNSDIPLSTFALSDASNNYNKLLPNNDAPLLKFTPSNGLSNFNKVFSGGEVLLSKLALKSDAFSNDNEIPQSGYVPLSKFALSNGLSNSNRILPGGEIPLSKLTLSDALNVEAKTKNLISKLALKKSMTPNDLNLYKIVNNDNIIVRYPFKSDVPVKKTNGFSVIKETSRVMYPRSLDKDGKNSQKNLHQIMQNQTKASYKTAKMKKFVSYIHDWENRNSDGKVWNSPSRHKRQYPLSFQFEPSVKLNSKCPPKETISCLEVVSQVSCNHDSECLDLRLGCCQTSCAQQEFICLTKEN